MFKRVGVLLLKDRLVLFMSEIQKWFILPSSHVTAYDQALCELTLCGIECNSTKYTNVWDSESSFIVLDYQLVFQFHLLLSAFPSNCIGTDLFSNLCLELGFVLSTLHTILALFFLLPLFHRVHFNTSILWFKLSSPQSSCI